MCYAHSVRVHVRITIMSLRNIHRLILCLLKIVQSGQQPSSWRCVYLLLNLLHPGSVWGSVMGRLLRIYSSMALSIRSTCYNTSA